MTRSDPQSIERALRKANLDKTDAEEWTWMRQRWPDISDGVLEDLRQDRQRNRTILCKRAAAHHRYVKNWDALKAKASLQHQSRLVLLRHDPVELERFRQAHREAQSRYHNRHKDTINAKARSRRCARKKVDAEFEVEVSPMIAHAKTLFLLYPSSYWIVQQRASMEDSQSAAKLGSLTTAPNGISATVSNSSTDTPLNTAVASPSPVVVASTTAVDSSEAPSRASQSKGSSPVTKGGASPVDPASNGLPNATPTGPSPIQDNVTLASNVSETTTNVPPANAASNGQLNTTPLGLSPVEGNATSPVKTSTEALPNNPASNSQPPSSDTAPSNVPSNASLMPVDQDEDEEEFNGGSPGVGHPSNFSGDQLEYMEEHLAQFMSYPARSNEQSEFWPAFFPPFLEFFPLANFNLPPSNATPLETYTPDAFAALTVDEQRTYKRKLKYRERTPEERYKDMVKSYFRWRAGHYTRKGTTKGINRVLTRTS
ncbi:hypothetical protein VNI00_015542 [Paramarasmius palmivorus]|uniref:Uncharacterized protein n=1 Tax=Paramarasmius palmivorus TaxID=297713 RepID=A0AAW0BN10_9AGAR